MSRPLLGALGVAGVIGVAAWQWRLIRRERLNRRQLVAQLDEALDLKARLLTAVEFANVSEPPALYPRLLEETAKTLPEASRHLPPVVNRSMVVLAVALLLLWWWPWPATRLPQLAMRPTAVTPPPSELPSPQPDPPKPSPDQRQDQSGASGDRSEKGEGGSGEQAGQQRSSDNAAQGDDQSKGREGAHQPSQSGQQQHASQQQGQASANAASKTRAGQGESAPSNAAQAAQRAQAAGGQQGGGSSVQQELLKADIQQLLKELSTELKQLQAELEATQRDNQPNPMAGTSTDPELYDATTQLDKAAGSRLPVQLEVDTQPTASTRRGGGTGKPSTEVADALPQQQPEEADLSEVRTTEEGVASAPIPPEYRPVFERLSQSRE